jgi:peptide/nickel transport system substrate-binding protein
LDRRRWTTRSELRFSTVSWIEHTYNRCRRQRALGRLTPVEFELAFGAASDEVAWLITESTELWADPCETIYDMAQLNEQDVSRGRGLKRRTFLGLAGGTGVAGVLAPTFLDAIDGTGAGAATPTPGGTLNWRINAEPATLDPAGQVAGSTNTSYGVEPFAIYDSLVTFNVPKSSYVYRTAVSITPNSAQTVWTIKLHPGITFTDGTAYDANAINFHWNRIKNPATASPTAPSIVGWTWTVVDAQTFQVTLPSPLGNFLELMAGGLGAIPSPTAVTKYGALYGSSPSTTVGAGPFTMTAWTHGTAITVTKNPNYWQSGKPYLDTIIFTNLPDNPTAVNAMLTNQFQIAYFNISDQNTVALTHAGYPAATNPYIAAYGIYYQFAQAPYSDVRIRQALILATNNVDANLKSTAGASPLATAWFPKTSVMYDPSVKQKSNNLAAAQRLINSYIAEKGAIPSPQPITCPTNSFLVNLGTALQQQWAKLTGVTFQLAVTATSAAAILAFSKGQFGVAVTLTPGWLYVADAYPTLYSTSAANVTHYNNPKVDALITAGSPYQDIPHRKTYLNQIGQLLISDAAYGRIYFNVYWQFGQHNVANLSTANNFTAPTFPDPTILYLKTS